MNILKENTKSLCPVCLQEIAAQIIEENGKIYMHKRCIQDGDFKFLLEKDAEIYKRLMNKNSLGQRRPFNNIMIAVTHSCNINCPVCYLPNRDIPDLSLEDIKKAISNFDGKIIRLSGGEPTLREDLPQIIEFACKLGKRPGIITNGLRLADRRYVRVLKNSGLRYVHFSFNGFNDKTYQRINGRSLLKIKLKALDNLKRENMNIRISVMLVKGINEKELKKIYRYCLRNSRFVSALRIRAVVAVGRWAGSQEQIYLSDIITAISKIIGVSKKELIEHSLSLPQKDHLPCGLNIHFIRLLLKDSNIGIIKNALFRKIKIVLHLLPKVGLRTFINLPLGKIGKGPSLSNFHIFLRVWPDKYRIDLDEMKRCPSSHLISTNGETVPFCYGLILNDNTLLL